MAWNSDEVNLSASGRGPHAVRGGVGAVWCRCGQRVANGWPPLPAPLKEQSTSFGPVADAKSSINERIVASVNIRWAHNGICINTKQAGFVPRHVGLDVVKTVEIVYVVKLAMWQMSRDKSGWQPMQPHVGQVETANSRLSAEGVNTLSPALMEQDAG